MIIKGTDTLFVFNISNENGPQDLTGASSSLLLAKNEEEEAIEIPCEVLNASTGVIQVNLNKEILNVSGTYNFQIKIIDKDLTVSKSAINTFYIGDSLD